MAKGRKKEEGRRKKEEGRRKKEESPSTDFPVGAPQFCKYIRRGEAFRQTIY
jgi:hypothetical protein